MKHVRSKKGGKTKKERTTWTANTGENNKDNQKRRENKTAQEIHLTQEDKTTKIKQETMKSNPKP